MIEEIPQRQEPVYPTITLEMRPEGVAFQSTVGSLVMALGMLEIGKATVMQTAQQASNPGLLLARGGLPKMNGG